MSERACAMLFNHLVRIGRWGDGGVGPAGCRLQCQREILRRGKAVGFVFGQRTGYHGIYCGRQHGVDAAGGRWVLVGNLADDGEVAVAIKRTAVCQQLVQHNTGRERVGLGIHRATLDLFRGHVLERAHHAALGARRLARVLYAGYAKVSQLDAAIGLYQQVGGLDVAVDDFAGMGVVQSGQKIAHHAHGLV